MIVARQVGYELNNRRLAKLRDELGYTAGSFLKTVSLTEERERIQQFMEDASPSGGDVSETKKWLDSAGIRPLGLQFAKAWRVRRQTEGSRIVWVISNVLTSGTREERAKFFSIEFGSKTRVWTAKRSFSFKNRKWYHIAEGTEVIHWGNKPADVIGQTRTFVENVMMPELRAKVTNIVRQRYNRI